MDAALQAALRVRRLAVAAAQRNLSDAILAESAAADADAAAGSAVAREIAIASQISAGDAAVESLAAWLPRGRAAQRAAGEALAEASARTGQARAILAAARGAEAAVELLIEKNRLAREADAARRDQSAIDEAAARAITET